MQTARPNFDTVYAATIARKLLKISEPRPTKIDFPRLLAELNTVTISRIRAILGNNRILFDGSTANCG